MPNRSLLAVALLAAAVAAGPRTEGELTRVSRELAVGRARAVTVEIKLGAGDIGVGTGAAGLLEVDSHGPDSAGAPVLEYAETAAGMDAAGEEAYHGHARVVQSPEGDSDAREFRWDVRLNPDRCRELQLVLGAGSVNVDLSGTAVGNARIKAGVGDITLRLTDAADQGFKAECEAGVGTIRARVPAGARVRVDARCAVGKVEMPEGYVETGAGWVSPEWADDRPGIELLLKAGVGNVVVAGEAGSR